MRKSLVILIPYTLIVLGGCARPSLHARRIKAGERSPLTEHQLEAEATADARFQGPPGGRNATPEFRTLFHKSADGKEVLTDALLEKLRGYDVLMVHGLMGEVGIGVRKVLDKVNSEQGLIDYFKDQEDVFRAYGLPFERVVFRSNSVDRSGGKIVEAVLAAKRPVILFTHSKGCVDTLDALLKLQAQVKLDRVAGWISLQGPFYGSPQAERYVENGGLRVFGIAAMRVMGGNFDAVRDLAPDARTAYMKEHAGEIERLVKNLPLICYTSWEAPETKSKKSDKIEDAEQTPGEQAVLTSAFHIQPESCLLPGCTYVGKSGVSHSDTVISGPKFFDRDAMTRALLAMLAERLPKTR